jgi:two-component system NtrC family sensor kinase
MQSRPWGEKGELKISLALEPQEPAKANRIIIKVADSGPGIKAEHLDKIFDPLFTTKEDEEDKGAGLGLFVVKQMVQEFKGKIQVRSKIGEGTVFEIDLPFKSPLP